MTDTQGAKLTKKDFASDQEVRWCPGCGDYAILNAVQKYLAESGKDPANRSTVRSSRCSSRAARARRSSRGRSTRTSRT